VILDRVGQTVTLLFHDFRNVSCDEEILSEAHRYALNSFLPSTSRVGRFQYIILRRPLGDLPGFIEYRTDLKGNHVDVSTNDASLQGFFMVTRDFTSTFLYFSPADQHINRYQYLGMQAIRSRECHVVGFGQDPANVHRANRFYFGNLGIVALVQGVAWIDAQSFQILRVMI
jgi:hypothetical protein